MKNDLNQNYVNVKLFSEYWPKIFNTKDLKNECDAALCGYALAGWGICMMGITPHPNFGEVMVLIGDRLGISPLPENFLEWSKKWRSEKN